MKVLIDIKCDNEAFSENVGMELGRILHDCADKFRYGYDFNVQEISGTKLRDINGNTVGTIQIED